MTPVAENDQENKVIIKEMNGRINNIILEKIKSIKHANGSQAIDYSTTWYSQGA